MSSSQYRSQLERVQRQRADAEKRVGVFRTKEADRRATSTQRRESALRTSSKASANANLRDAARLESDANAAGKEAARWQTRVAELAREEASLHVKIARSDRSERELADRRRTRDEQAAARRAASEQATIQRRLGVAEGLVNDAFLAQRVPKRERLRVLILGASSDGDLRVGREQKRIRTAVESALHRDLVELDVRPSATTVDLLDGITKFRPHVVHFSGHGDNDLIVLEDEIDEPHEGMVVTARAFAHAVAATDVPPLLVVMNACNSAAQIPLLVSQVAPFAIGMAAEIEDADAINYAAQFYAAIANGQSILSAHLSGQAALELAGLSGADLPTLGHAADADPARTVLVKPPA
jgi:CHAT domain